MKYEFDAELKRLLAGDGLNRNVLLAVSGGVDSMTMAELFSKSSVSLSFSVAHVNFSLRGEASDADESLVREWCVCHGVKLHTKRFDTAEYASSHGISIEMAARELRYGWFDELADQYGYDFIAVAHNLNDSVETMYLNLLRGTGIRGLAGIRSRNGRIIRPMLVFSRERIVSFAQSSGIVWREDATNAESLYKRNRLRNEVFPHFAAINPSFLATAGQEMHRFAQAQAILDETFARLKSSAISTSDDGVVTVDIPMLRSSGHVSYWLFRIMEEYGFNSSQIEQMEASLTAQSGRRFESETHIVIKDRELLVIYPSDFRPLNYASRTFDRPEGFDPKNAPVGVLYADADLLDGDIFFRSPQPGDRFVPLGMKGSRLVSDFLTDLKVDVMQKGLEMITVCRKKDGSEIIAAVAGRRIAEPFKVTSSTKRIVEIYCLSDTSAS